MAATINIHGGLPFITLSKLPSGTHALNLDSSDVHLTIFFKDPAEVAQFRYKLIEAVEGLAHEEAKKVVI
jgi:hypothetical protein